MLQQCSSMAFHRGRASVLAGGRVTFLATVNIGEAHVDGGPRRPPRNTPCQEHKNSSIPFKFAGELGFGNLQCVVHKLRRGPLVPVRAGVVIKVGRVCLL